MKKAIAKIALALTLSVLLTNTTVCTGAGSLVAYAAKADDSENYDTGDDYDDDDNDDEDYDDGDYDNDSSEYNYYGYDDYYYDDFEYDDGDCDNDDDYYDDDCDNHRQENWDDVPVDDVYYAYLYAHIHDNDIEIGSSTIAYVDISTNASLASLEVNWSSSDSSVADVSGDGNSASITGNSEGSAVITATLYMEGEYADSESVSVRVKRAQPQYISVNGIDISDSSVNISIGESRQISAWAKPDNANNRGITWSSSNESVVQVDQDGTLHGISAGQANVYANTDENGYYTSCTVVVNGSGIDPVSAVAVNPTSVTLAVNQYIYITPSVYPDSAADKSVSWSSSDSQVATVSTDGKVTGLSAGQAVITCRTNDGGKTATTVVTVGSAVATPAASSPVIANNTRSPQFCCLVVQMILTAAPNATIAIPSSQAMAYDVNVAAALIARPDVTLVCSFSFQGHNISMALPAGYGTKLISHCDVQGYAEWLQLCALKDGPICKQLN